MGHHHDHDHEHYYDDSYIHDNQRVFLKHYLEMLDTCNHGIQYILAKIENNEASIDLFQDCFAAFKAMRNANFLAGNLFRKIEPDTFQTIEEYKKDIEPLLEKLLLLKEKDDLDGLILLFKGELSLKYSAWSKKVNQALQHHVQIKEK